MWDGTKDTTRNSTSPKDSASSQDANWVYVDQARQRFPSFLAEGQLRLYHVAIAEHSGSTDFWTFEDH